MKTSMEIKDLYLAGYLYACGLPFIGTRREGRVCWFEFGEKSKCIELQSSFLSRKGMVSAKDYADALRTLKQIIFDF